MKNTAKRLLCLVLVLMLAIPFAAFPAGAATAYDSASEGDLLYEVNFNGTSDVFGKISNQYDGMSRTVSDDGRSIRLKANTTPSTAGSVWSGEMLEYTAPGKSYTVVFTVEADNDQSVGIFLKWKDGFFVNPTANTYSVGHCSKDGADAEKYIEETSYDGTGEAKQTYAIEFANKETTRNIDGDSHKEYEYTAYNLYVWKDNAWSLIVELDTATCGGIAWDTNDYEFMVQLARVSEATDDGNTNTGDAYVSDMNVYKGAAVAGGYLNETRAYYVANDGDLLYTANFNGDEIYNVGEAWAGMTTKTVLNGGNAIELKPIESNEAAAFGKEMDTTNYPAQGNSYTMVFTATASDEDQEIGLYPDWSTGFVVVPGKNQFKYNKTLSDRTKNETIVDYTEYNGTGSLTQTYAIEYKLNDDFDALEYNLYVAQNGNWVLLYSLDADELEAGPNWSTTDYETVIRLYRDSKIANQTSGTVTVSDLKVYKGLAAKSGAAAAPADAVNYSYDGAKNGQAIYKPNLGGDAILANPKDAWAGLKYTADEAGTAITLKPWNTNEQYGGWGATLKGYSIAGKSYTAVFSVKVKANEHEIGFLPDGRTGFVIAPAYNEYRFITTNDEGVSETVITEGTYKATSDWDQTYAIEWKVDDDWNVIAYKLYVAYAGEWVLACELTANELAQLTFKENGEDTDAVLGWGPDTDTFDFMFIRNQPDKNDIVVSNVTIYKGLGATLDRIPVAAKNVPYSKAENGDLLYDVNFKGTKNVFKDVKPIYDGINRTISSDGSSVKLTTQITPSVSGSVFSGEMEEYTIPGNAYTVVFTLDVEDADQSVGVFLKWKDGFVITPGQNAYYVGHTHNNADGGTTPIGSVYGISGTYDGSGALTQTYAIEIASGDAAGSDGKYECTVYNLYVLQEGAWVLVCSLNAEQRQKIAWNETDFEFMVQLARISEAEGENAGSVTVSDMKIYKGNNILPELGAVNGASVRLSEPTGIRFTGSVNKAYFDDLVVKYGAENVTIGMLITPTDYLVDNGLAFTKDALDACNDITGVKYLAIDAATVLDAGVYYKVNCAIVNVLEANYNRSFSARLYIKVNGEIFEYAKYNEANNSRSIADVAKAAYYDVKAEADSVYKYAATLSVGTTVYSPYQNRDVLQGFFETEESNGTSITVMTYNIRTYDDADSIWDQITGDYEGWGGRDVSYALGTITELMPDVIGLQEDDQNLYNEYKNVPALEQNYERINAGGNGNEGNEILYKKGVVTLISTGTGSYKELASVYADDENIANADFSADIKGTNEVGRFFRWAIFEKDGVQFLVVNTHLHYKASSSSSSSDQINKDLRKAQATILRRWMVDNEEAATCDIKIVMGDMNAQGDSQEMRYGFLNGTGALDLAKDNAVCVGDVGGTLVGEGFSGRQSWVYDHILYSGDTLTAFEYSVVNNYDAAPAPTDYPSDHLPVIAKFICK